MKIRLPCSIFIVFIPFGTLQSEVVQDGLIGKHEVMLTGLFILKIHCLFGILDDNNSIFLHKI